MSGLLLTTAFLHRLIIQNSTAGLGHFLWKWLSHLFVTTWGCISWYYFCEGIFAIFCHGAAIIHVSQFYYDHVMTQYYWLGLCVVLVGALGCISLSLELLNKHLFEQEWDSPLDLHRATPFQPRSIDKHSTALGDGKSFTIIHFDGHNLPQRSYKRRY